MKMNTLRAVLGIDAAWTPTQPSGVALVAETANGWHLLTAESSYQNFHASIDRRIMREPRPTGSLPNVPALLETASTISERTIDLVAVDMPLAYSQITCRRLADNEVSREYGARHCSTHSPSALRPGAMSDNLRLAFAEAGYPLRTQSPITPGLIEVYPHPALVELTEAPLRLRYKVSKSRSYWPGREKAEREQLIFEQWDKIINCLDREIGGVRAALLKPRPGPQFLLKAYEDMLDAVVCAWVAICVLEGRARAFGNADSAIWIPCPRNKPNNQTFSYPASSTAQLRMKPTHRSLR